MVKIFVLFLLDDFEKRKLNFMKLINNIEFDYIFDENEEDIVEYLEFILVKCLN